MITLFACAHFFNFVSLLLYPAEVKRLKCAMLGAFTVNQYKFVYKIITKCNTVERSIKTYNGQIHRLPYI